MSTHPLTDDELAEIRRQCADGCCEFDEDDVKLLLATIDQARSTNELLAAKVGLLTDAARGLFKETPPATRMLQYVNDEELQNARNKLEAVLKDLPTEATALLERLKSAEAGRDRLWESAGYVCDGCGSTEPQWHYDAMPGVITCCPERKMISRAERERDVLRETEALRQQILAKLHPEKAEAALSAKRVVTPKQIEEFARDACQWLCELPDRTSPDDWPEACLVTGDEMHDYLVERLTEALFQPAPGETE